MHFERTFSLKVFNLSSLSLLVELHNQFFDLLQLASPHLSLCRGIYNRGHYQKSSPFSGSSLFWFCKFVSLSLRTSFSELSLPTSPFNLLTSFLKQLVARGLISPYLNYPFSLVSSLFLSHTFFFSHCEVVSFCRLRFFWAGVTKEKTYD